MRGKNLCTYLDCIFPLHFMAVCLHSFCHFEGIFVLGLVLFALGSAFLFVSHAQRRHERQTNETERKRLPNPTTIDRPHRSTSNEEVSTGFQSSVALPKYTYIQKRNEYNSCALSRLSIATLQRALSWINERVEVNRTALISDL